MLIKEASKVLTSSGQEYREKLAETMKRLGDNSNNCYALIEASSGLYKIEFCNTAYLELTGFSEEELIGVPYNRLFSYLSPEDFVEIDEKLRLGEILQFELYHGRKDKDPFNASMQCFPLQNESHENEFIFVIVTDITHKMIAKKTQELERKMFRAIEREKTFFEKLTLSCSFLDKTLGPNVFSTIVMKMDNQLYITSAIPFEKSHTHLIPKGMAHSYYKLLMKMRDSKVFSNHKGYPLSAIHQQFALEHELQNCWQIPIQTHSAEIIGVITIFFKVQEKPKEFYDRFMTKVINLIGLAYNYELKQQQIYKLAYTDSSTGLSNRHDFIQKLHFEHEGAVLIVQPAEFSKFVKLYGRNFGDELLKQLAYKFERIPKINVVSQFSSSSLALHLYGGYETEESLKDLLKKVTTDELTIFGNSIYVSLKIGVEKLTPLLHVDVACRNAENALSTARNKAGEKIVYYNEQMQQKLKKELSILNALVNAIERKEFEVHVQPKVEMYRGRIYGMEALVRWNSPKLGKVAPSDFIQVAEQSGLIRDVDLIVIEKVLQWMQQRYYDGKRITPVAVNISPEHFYHPEFVDGLLHLVRKYYVDPRFIVIEVTESISLVDIDVAMEILYRLRNYGFHTSIDDFGIGYSSLSYLQRLFFSELKIDRSFISKIHEPGAYNIVKAIIQMAKSLDIMTVAEGIETEEQYHLLKELGCNVGQGYYLYHPMSLEDLNNSNII